MKIIVEGYCYKSELALKILRPLELEQNGVISISKVGYYYNSTLKDTVFILPKVVLDEHHKFLGKYDPEEIVDFTTDKIEDDDYQFIYGLSVWIFRAISVYIESHSDNTIVYNRSTITVDNAGEEIRNTFLDIMLSLIKFNRENQDFITFILREIHSGYDKINWSKTVDKSNPIFGSDGTSVYLNVVNKKRQVNYDEELLIIFFSILRHIHEKYGFPVTINFGYELLNESEMESYLEGYGQLRLEQIRSRYYSDKMLLLWQRCYDFFSRSSEVATSDFQEEYLLVKDFNIVFEAIEFTSIKNLC